jgi:S1-C subfamily serine protease
MRPRAAPLGVVAALVCGCGGGPIAAAPPVVSVRVHTGPQTDADATAFAIGAGRIVTVAHVLRRGRPVYVAGRRAEVLSVDRRLDVAVLAVRDAGALVPHGGSARAGDRVTVRVLRAGAARSLRATVRRPITARVGRAGGPARVRPALELAARVAPGDSGAPVVDSRGRVVGIVFAQASDREALAYALDARALGSILPPP